MNPKTAKLIAAVMAEQDGLPAGIEAGEQTAALRLALALSSPESGIARAAAYARAESADRLLDLGNAAEAKLIRGLEESVGKTREILQDQKAAPLGREIGVEYRRVLIAEQVAQLRAMPEPAFSFIDEDTASDFRELAAHPGRKLGPFWERLQAEQGISSDTLAAVVDAFRSHASAQAMAGRLQEFLDQDFSPSHVAAEKPLFRAAVLEERAADEQAAFREQTTLEAEREALKRREAELKEAARDLRNRRALSIDEEAQRKERGGRVLADAAMRGIEEANDRKREQERQLQERGLPENFK